MGARDYVKPVSSHEAVFVGSTNFPKDLQRYNQKSRSSIGKTKELEYCRPYFGTSLKLELTLYNIVASTDLKSGY
jgi:hypothetical protein